MKNINSSEEIKNINVLVALVVVWAIEYFKCYLKQSLSQPVIELCPNLWKGFTLINNQTVAS